MSIARPLIAALVCSAAGHAAELPALIDRPVTLARGAFDLTLHGTYTNWNTVVVAGGGGSSLAGETLALAADFGVADGAQFGLAAAFPVNPGAGFGSILGSAAIAASKSAAMRLDLGLENIGFNGNTAGVLGSSHAIRFFGALGASIKAALGPAVAFVVGRSGAVHFGHFNNIGNQGTGLYAGASGLADLSSDFIVLSHGTNDNSSTNLALNLPAGLLLQPDPHFALTLLAGYSATIAFPGSGSAQALHFVPIGVEAVVTPAAPVDIGLRFMFDGYVAETGAGVGSAPGYFDLRALMLWLTVHAG